MKILTIFQQNIINDFYDFFVRFFLCLMIFIKISTIFRIFVIDLRLFDHFYIFILCISKIREGEKISKIWVLGFSSSVDLKRFKFHLSNIFLKNQNFNISILSFSIRFEDPKSKRVHLNEFLFMYLSTVSDYKTP